MLAFTSLVLAASFSTGSAVIYQGFNYGADADFENDFNTAKNLVGTSGFTSARLYTMIQQNTTDTPTAAIPAAIDTDTTPPPRPMGIGDANILKAHKTGLNPCVNMALGAVTRSDVLEGPSCTIHER